MNPSVKDILTYVNKIPNKNILILPNNSNIILTADTVKKNIKDKNIFVLPTKSLSQGIVALYNINKKMIDFDSRHKKRVETGTSMNDVNVKKGEFIAIKGKEILSSVSNLMDSIISLASSIIETGIDVLNIIYNDDVTSEQQQEIIK